MILAVGIVWILQGAGVLADEGGMNGESSWVGIGALVALVGLALLINEFRRR